MDFLKYMTLPTYGDCIGALSLAIMFVMLLMAPVPMVDPSPALPELRGAMGK